MRDNGLPGADYVALADLDSGLVDAVLTMLREAGVPAYAETTTPAQGPHDAGASSLEAAPSPASGLTDRLFVERARADQARLLLAEGLPTMRADAEGVDSLAGGPAAGSGVPAADTPRLDTSAAAPVEVDDDVWAGIVASFRAPSADMSGRVLPPPSAPPASTPPAHPAPQRELDAAHEFELLDRDDFVEPDDHFEPEPPPPLPRITVVTALAWAAVLLMPALFLLALWLHIDVTGWLGLFGVSAFVGGFLVLVSRLGDGPEDWDDGAVV